MSKIKKGFKYLALDYTQTPDYFDNDLAENVFSYIELLRLKTSYKS